MNISSTPWRVVPRTGSPNYAVGLKDRGGRTLALFINPADADLVTKMVNAVEKPNLISDEHQQALEMVGNLTVLNNEALAALAAYEKAYDIVLEQCRTRGLFDYWGDPVNWLQLKKAHELADKVLNPTGEKL